MDLQRVSLGALVRETLGPGMGGLASLRLLHRTTIGLCAHLDGLGTRLIAFTESVQTEGTEGESQCFGPVLLY